MTREELATASDLLESAADAAGGDAADRLADLAGQLETLAERDQSPDHGRLARIELALDDVAESVDDDVAAHIEEAHEYVISFRETVEGV